MKSSFNSLFKSSLTNLDENDVSDLCKLILKITELSVPISKSIIKIIE